MLIDDGLLHRRGGRWVPVGDLSAIAVPRTIQALLAARVDRLTPNERAVVEAAAVVGKEFFTGAVRELVPAAVRPRVPSQLMSLVRKDLIRPERSTLPGEDAFLFRHLIVRDAAYEAIPKGLRAELHERYAEWLEAVGGTAVVEQEEIVGYHLERAHVYRTELHPPDARSAALGARAAARLSAAGRRASARGDARAAANLLRRALALMPDEEPARAPGSNMS
jgi:predicted ATPase